ncbi:DUF3558 family protein [Micromonospora radicis]|nr:DUF3558 family protein [Micromonospora radicis]
MITAPAVPLRRRRAVAARRWGCIPLALVLALAGCAEGPPTGAPTADRSGPAVEPTRAAGAAERVDGCSLLTEAEVTAVIGRNDGGRATSEGCLWENPDTYHSVSLHIGLVGTAPGGVLPSVDPMLGPAEAGPDGIRFVLDEAEFAVGDRICRLRVVTKVTDSSDRTAMIRLARQVSGRL